ncbi:Na+/H+ antiporter [Oryzihumus sp.]|uniref:Na+/H+ antiporter n=1 Tax=Oryzihumus sp. TaxID=1968903 RepID=UPI002ED87CCF
MHAATVALALVATVTLVAGLARRYDVSAPLVLTLVGVGASYLPFLPQVHLSAEVVLVGLLPPLLYAAAIRSSLVDFRDNRRAIGFLSVGLVVFTALGVGLVTWLLLPVPFAAAFALGAVVAPPDAVAATTIARRIGLPRRVVTVLEGESLVNDATALVCLRTAIAAIAGTVSVGGVAGQFALSALGGLAVGVAVAALVGLVRKHVTDSVLDTSLSFMTPFVAYLPAEAIHASGVLAVVVAGLLLGHKAPVLQSASSRLSERINWTTIQFILENVVFLVIGLQVRWVLEDVRHSPLGLGQIAGVCLAVLAAVIVLRPLWVFPARYLAIRPGPDRLGRSTPWTHTAIVSWAGMRGVVTLAAAFVLPAATPHREVLVLAALVVTGGTLMIQGFSLPWLARRLRVHGPDPREDALQEATVLQTAVTAGLAELDRIAGEDEANAAQALRARAESRTNIVWERLGSPDSDRETPSETYRRLRLAMLAAEREAVLQIRDDGRADHEVLEHVMAALDLEESMLDRVERRTQDLRDEPLLPPDPLGGPCEHLAGAGGHIQPLTPGGCDDCEREGLTPVHLRLCLTCGKVGCCDSSVGRHAERHFTETGHPVVRSFEPGEAWRWCYVDDLVG